MKTEAFPERLPNEANLDDTLNLIKMLCLKYNLRVGQLFENIRFLSKDEDLFHYSNKRLIKSLETFDKE